MQPDWPSSAREQVAEWVDRGLEASAGALRTLGRAAGRTRTWVGGLEVRPDHRVAAAVAVLLVASMVGLVATGALVADSPPYAVGASREPQLRDLDSRSIVYDSTGGVLGYLHAGENRHPVDYEEFPQRLIDAVVAIEDQEFFAHEGIDVAGIARALRTNVDAGRVVQGASTITQQLAKLHLDPSERDLEAKVEETGLALALERRYEKEEILEHYLNAVYFGNGAYGVKAAAELYFDTTVENLSVDQAALLAGLIANPRRFDPIREPEAAEARRNAVLGRMAAEGTIERERARRLAERPLPQRLHPLEEAPEEAYFLAEVRRQLLRDERLGDTYEERFDTLFSGGLRIHTTVDRRLQRAALTAVRNGLPESPFTASLVAIEPTTGAVRAMVGGPGFDQQKFNLATQGARQPGSSFKVVTLTAALEAGFSPNDLVNGSAPCEFPMPHGQEPWRVRNYEGGGGGVVPLHQALSRSMNCAFARVVLALGPERVVDMAHRLGIDRHLDPYPSITLGAEEASPLEMATVFSTLAADGVRRGPFLVTKIVQADGTVLFNEIGSEERAVDASIARMVTAVLRQVIEAGTGTAADIGRPAAGKTGTAQQWRDAWFGGYTPQLAAAVWMGSPEGEVPMTNVGGIRVTGGSYPARIWAAFMNEALAPQPVVEFSSPDPSILPPAGYIDEHGRHAGRPAAPRSYGGERPGGRDDDRDSPDGQEPARRGGPPPHARRRSRPGGTR
ncbi:MAG TPA: PBP1A family penicillin-binding protein [Acidimicrobiia bacterium]|nr:PBP1A family penicillin-binding protein [Acidimicrobiia bacterium]